MDDMQTTSPASGAAAVPSSAPGPTAPAPAFDDAPIAVFDSGFGGLTVGVVATKATVESNAYTKAIRHLDAGITVFSTATPRFVEIAEQGIRMAEGPLENYTSLASKVYIRPAFEEIAREYLEPLRRAGVDTLVLGCTHFPLLKALIGGVMGREVTLISSSTEAARDVAEILARRSAYARADHEARYEFYTTGDDLEEFRGFGSRVFREPIDTVAHVDLV